MAEIEMTAAAMNSYTQKVIQKAVWNVLFLLDKTELTKTEYSKIFKISRPTLDKMINDGKVKLNSNKKISITPATLPLSYQGEPSSIYTESES